MAKPDQDTRTLFEQLIPTWTRTNEQLDQVHAELRSHRGILLRGAEPRAIPNGQSISVSFSPGQLAGFALRETAGAAAVVRLHDGVDVNGALILPIALTADQSVLTWLQPHGVAFVDGLFVEVVSGAVEGVVYLGPSGA